MSDRIIKSIRIEESISSTLEAETIAQIAFWYA